MATAVEDDTMNDQMRNLKKWIDLRSERHRGRTEARVEGWKRSSLLSGGNSARRQGGKKTSHCMKTGGFADWERSKVDGVRMSWGGEKKVREATDSQAVSWDAVLSRGILFPVAVIILQSLNLLLTLEKLLFEKIVSTQIFSSHVCGISNIFYFPHTFLMENKCKCWLKEPCSYWHPLI